MKLGVIYKSTNNVNGKVYIGQTTTIFRKRVNKHINDAIRNKSNAKFAKAIRKYGKESFTWEIIKNCNSKESLDKAETLFIKKFNSTNDKHGYNIVPGPSGGSDTWTNPEEVRAKISKKRKGWKAPQNVLDNLLMYAKKNRSKEWKDKMSKMNTGKNNPFYGKKHSEEAKKKMSQAKKGTVPWNKKDKGVNK